MPPARLDITGNPWGFVEWQAHIYDSEPLGLNGAEDRTVAAIQGAGGGTWRSRLVCPDVVLDHDVASLSLPTEARWFWFAMREGSEGWRK